MYKFELKSGLLRVSDPGYPMKKEKTAYGYLYKHMRAKPGVWKVSIPTTKQGLERDLFAYHSSVNPKTIVFDSKPGVVLGVDSGQMGVYDAKGFPKTEEGHEFFYDHLLALNFRFEKNKPVKVLQKARYKTHKWGVVCAGFGGDGAYPLLVYRKKGVALAVKVIFNS